MIRNLFLLHLTALSLLLATGALAQGNKAQPTQGEGTPRTVFSMPELYGRHLQLLEQLKRCIATRNYEEMEKVCRAAVELLPDDGVWHYNLACALARNGHSKQALDELEKSVRCGYVAADQIAADSDLATLRRDRRFQQALSDARYFASRPQSLPNATKPSPVADKAVVDVGNTRWDMDGGFFVAQFDHSSFRTHVLETNEYVKVPGKTGEMLRQWQQEGTAAGNIGDLYNNLDRGHSYFNLSAFPEMRPVVYAKPAQDAMLNIGVSKFSFGSIPVIGNSSMARKDPITWRSMARQAQSAPFAKLLVQQYFGNQTYVYPQHEDYRSDKFGDVFPVRTPFLFIAPGSSFTDKPILAALASAMAAFRPETKRKLVETRILAPTLQYLLRLSLKNVKKTADYLTPAAHPVVFNGADIDTLKLVRIAHSLTTNNLPPVAAFRVVHEDNRRLLPFVDYFDAAQNEHLFDSAFACARVFRGMDYTRKVTLSANLSTDLSGKPLRFHWFVGQGDASHVRITPIDPSGMTVELEFDYQKPGFDTPYGVTSSRADVILVVDNGTHFSAPAFFSYFFLPNEKRLYAPDCRILSVDYAAASDNYVDPEVSLPKDWVDTFTYDEENRCTGWTRSRKGQKKSESYSLDGLRIAKRDDSGKIVETVAARYGAKDEPTADGSRRRVFFELQ